MSEVTILEHSPQKRAKKPPNGKHYSFLNRTKNPDFQAGLMPLEIGNPNNPLFESCLYTIKSDRFEPKNDQKASTIFVKTQPKWFTNLLEQEYDKETGELLAKGVYQTNDFKTSNGKKIKKLDQFCNYYQPLYKERKVTLWFLTFTRANHSRLSFKQMNNIVKKYYKREGMDIRGFIWTYEISKDNYHWHYHLCLATDRINIKGKGLPTKLKFDFLWGQRTELEFVKKDIRHYMAKYFAKCDFRLDSRIRSYGSSKKFN
jgi:hypothetical protein